VNPHAAGWYPDPTGRYEYRYHNGAAWTGDVAVRGDRFVDPLPALPEPGWAWAPPVTLPPANGAATAAMVLGIVAAATGATMFLFPVAAPCGLLAIVLGFVGLRRARRSPGAAATRGRGRAVAGVVCGAVGVILAVVGYFVVSGLFRSVFDELDLGAYSVTERACGVRDGLATFDGAITNEASSTRTYRVVVAFLRGGTDNVLRTDSTEVRSVGPGETVPFTASAFVRAEEVDCTVQLVLRVPFADG
jgi:hypothetical protein